MADKALALILVFRGEETDILHTLSSQEEEDYNLQPASEGLGIEEWSDPQPESSSYKKLKLMFFA